MPPLNALKAFEAAARHESFAHAAAELSVTPAAVSQQIKQLEAWLGSPLFKRRAHGLQLTDAGRAALPSLTSAFDALGGAVHELRAYAPRDQIVIAALPAIAQLWLAPRLPRLRSAFPNFRPSIHAIEEPPDFRREPFDLAIFLTGGGHHGITVCEDVIFPVCAPQLATEIATPADIVRLPLLRDTSWARDWSLWLAAAGMKDASPQGGAAFSLYSLAVQAAIDGAGVLMAHEALVAEPLAAGLLVAPLERRAKTGMSLRILSPERTSQHIVDVAAWLRTS